MRLDEVLVALERRAPLGPAAGGDTVGLLRGDPAAAVERVLTCLTLTADVAAEAKAAGVQLIVTHHPVLFRPVQRLTAASAEGRVLLSLARAGIAVYSAHTAYDNSRGGINDLLAERLGLANVTPLQLQPAPPRCKLVVFVPEPDLGRVSDALFAAGAGVIGDYEQCSFRLTGTGTFFGLDTTSPTVGQKGRREEVAEWRLGVVGPKARLGSTIAGLRQAHSYEEPAFDVYPLEAGPGADGVGRRGTLSSPVAPTDFASLVCQALGSGGAEAILGSRPVQSVGIVCGAGGSLLGEARAAGVDAFVTGEMRFHDQLAAREAGLSVILPGHYATERPGVERLARQIAEACPGLECFASQQEKPPAAWWPPRG